jgi:hypothetical protein
MLVQRLFLMVHLQVRKGQETDSLGRLWLLVVHRFGFGLGFIASMRAKRLGALRE